MRRPRVTTPPISDEGPAIFSFGRTNGISLRTTKWFAGRLAWMLLAGALTQQILFRGESSSNPGNVDYFLIGTADTNRAYSSSSRWQHHHQHHRRLEDTVTPTDDATLNLTINPTIEVTPSPETESPSASFIPSDTPSVPPSMSIQPSFSPTTTFSPTNLPTITPMPTVTSPPSATPTSLSTTLSPTDGTSNFTSTPSAFPSKNPTIAPAIPTGRPTLATATIRADKIVMIIDGMPGLLNENETVIWENVTSNHVINYYAEWDELLPDISNTSFFDITIVTTALLAQSIIEMSQLFDNAVVLRLEYSQEITYGIYDGFDVPEEDLETYLFILPFQSDSKSYKVELIDALDLSNFIILDLISLGDPIPPPAPSPSEGRLSPTAVRAISASIVLGACVIVAFLLWDRNRKDFRYHEDSSERGDETFRRGPSQQDLDMTEFDNAGQPIDWANPYTDTGVAVVRTADRAGTLGGTRDESSVDESVMTEIAPLAGNEITGEDGPGGEPVPEGTTTEVGTLSTVESSAVWVPSPNPIGRGGPPSIRSQQSSRTAGGSGSLPPLAPNLSGGSGNLPSQGSRYNTLNSRGAFPSPLPPHHHGGFRQTSVADTDITDLTYSDGGFHSDRGSDTGLPTQLPPISDESLYVGDQSLTPFSPLHIPDEEALEIAAGLTPPASPIPSILGLSSDMGSPRMNGFDMQIEELE